LTGLLLAVLLASRIWFIVGDLRTEHAMQVAFSRNSNVVTAAQLFIANGRILTDQIKQRLAKDAAIPAAVRALPSDAFIASNQGQLLGHLSGRPVRMLPFGNESDLSGVTSRINQVFREMHKVRPVYLIFVPDNRIVRSPDAVDWQNKIASKLPTGYQLVGRDVNLLIFLAPAPSYGVKSHS
jgi:hypothetical protein